VSKDSGQLVLIRLMSDTETRDKDGRKYERTGPDRQ